MKLATSRSTDVQDEYERYKLNHGVFCDFCEVERSASEVLGDFDYFRLVTNAFPYSVWDRGVVTEHLLLVPHRHIDAIANFDEAESAEYIQLLRRFDALGYNIYGRSSDNQFKSIAHQHTHLIKIRDE